MEASEVAHQAHQALASHVVGGEEVLRLPCGSMAEDPEEVGRGRRHDDPYYQAVSLQDGNDGQVGDREGLALLQALATCAS